MPCQLYFSRRFGKLRDQAVQYTDQRLKLVNEVLVGFLAMKMYCWEKALSRSIFDSRKSEMKYISRAAMIKAFNNAIYFSSQALIAIIIFLPYFYSEGSLKASNIYPILAFFAIFKLIILYAIPESVQLLSEIHVSTIRIQQFLLLPNIKKNKLLPPSTKIDLNSIKRLDPSKYTTKYDDNGNKISIAMGTDTPDTQTTKPQESVSFQPVSTSQQPQQDPPSSGGPTGLTGPAGDAATTGATSPGGLPSIPADDTLDLGAAQQVQSQFVNPLSPAYIEMKNASFSWDLVPNATLKRVLTSKKTKSKKVEKQSQTQNETDNKSSGDNDSINDNDKIRHELSDITFRIDNNAFVGVIGKIACGKSSLLSAILGEIPMKIDINNNNNNNMNSKVEIEGTIAYAPQKPWIFNASVRHNILFDQKYDGEWYKKVVHACALKPDFDNFPHYDMTIIGERGINLSGGQKGISNMR